MIIKIVKTRVLKPPKDDLLGVIEKSIKSLPEKSIVVITSKVVSIWQGRCVPMINNLKKDDLVVKEADFYLPRSFVPGAWCMHTLKNNIFIPSAGVDESNANGFYILWPKNLPQTARELWKWLRKKYHVKNLGIIITDSHTIPLRRGVMGISLSHYGFNPLKDYRGKPDLFGRLFKMAQTNIADGLAAASVVVMGEGSESTPICIISDIPWVKFVSKSVKSKKPFSSFVIRTKEDLYYPLFSSVPWKKGKKRH
jgi:putative folate metabolism gamma-glutamate ligase